MWSHREMFSWNVQCQMFLKRDKGCSFLKPLFQDKETMCIQRPDDQRSVTNHYPCWGFSTIFLLVSMMVGWDFRFEHQVHLSTFVSTSWVRHSISSQYRHCHCQWSVMVSGSREQPKCQDRRSWDLSPHTRHWGSVHITHCDAYNSFKIFDYTLVHFDYTSAFKDFKLDKQTGTDWTWQNMVIC